MEQEGVVRLDAETCRDLLVTDSVGRVAFTTPTGPRIVPVNFVVSGNAVVFRTGCYTELAAYGPGERLAFEIDHLDNERRRGWSVIALGRGERAPETEEADPQPWAEGEKSILMRLAWETLTGRRIGGRLWPFPVVSGRGRGY